METHMLPKQIRIQNSNKRKLILNKNIAWQKSVRYHSIMTENPALKITANCYHMKYDISLKQKGLSAFQTQIWKNI